MGTDPSYRILSANLVVFNLSKSPIFPSLLHVRVWMQFVEAAIYFFLHNGRLGAIVIRYVQFDAHACPDDKRTNCAMVPHAPPRHHDKRDANTRPAGLHGAA